MKFSMTLMIDPDLHGIAKKYAEEKQISFSRLIHESLCVVLGYEGRLNADLRAQVEERIAAHPGRRALTAEEIERRAEIRKKMKQEAAEERRAARAAEKEAYKKLVENKREEDPRDVIPED